MPNRALRVLASRRRPVLVLGAALLAVSPVLADRAAVDVALVPGQKAVGEIAFEGEREAIELRLLAGERLKVIAKRGKKSPLVPRADLIDAIGDDVAFDPALKKDTSSKSLLKNVPVPTTGSFFLTIEGDPTGPTGTYSLKTAVKPAPKIPTVVDTITGASDEHVVEFDARPGTRLDVVVSAAKKSDVIPRVVAVLDPDGVEVDLQADGVKRKQTTTKDILKKVTLGAFGTYRLVIGGEGASQGDFTAKLKLKNGKPEKIVPDFTGLTGGDAFRGELRSIDIGAGDIVLGAGESASLTARGTYADGSQADLSRRVNWSTTDSRIAVIGNQPDDCGVVRPGVAGATEVFAFDSGAVAPSRLVLTGGATIDSLTIQPSSAFTVRDGESRRLVALAGLTGAAAGFETVDLTGVTLGPVPRS